MSSIIFEIIDYIVHILACAILCEIFHSIRNHSTNHIDEKNCCHHNFSHKEHKIGIVELNNFTYDELLEKGIVKKPASPSPPPPPKKK
jgi:hypothetical protein